MPKIGNNERRIHFVAEITKTGVTYIRGYKTKWDPVKKRSFSYGKRHIGRLHEDGRVAVCASFREDYPEYAEGDWYWGPEKTLICHQEYLELFPAKPGPKTDTSLDEYCDEEGYGELGELQTVALGSTWALEQIAHQERIHEDLRTIFGEDAPDILNLALFHIDENQSDDLFNDWVYEHYLQHPKGLSGQRVSELQASINIAKIEQFFKLRHDRNLLKAKEEKRPVSYALDNSATCCYSQTIDEAEFGHRKPDNPGLPQVNYTFVCDQETNEIVFTHVFPGSVNDTSIFATLLHNLKQGGYDLDDVIFATDRGMTSNPNTQLSLNLDLKFVQGVKIQEDALKSKILKYRETFFSSAFYSHKEGVYARTFAEPWQQKTSYSTVTTPVYLHIYRLPGKQKKAQEYTNEVMQMAEKLNEGYVPVELYQPYIKHLIKPKKNGDKWKVNYEKLDECTLFMQFFAIRSNCVSDPFESLSIYRLRQSVELDFNQFKNWCGGDRFRCTSTSFQGKFFILTLATSLRLMALKRAKKNETPDKKIPGNSLEQVLKKLQQLKADRRPNTNRFISRKMTKRQRTLFELLGVPTPPIVLR